MLFFQTHTNDININQIIAATLITIAKYVNPAAPVNIATPIPNTIGTIIIAKIIINKSNPNSPKKLSSFIVFSLIVVIMVLLIEREKHQKTLMNKMSNIGKINDYYYYYEARCR